MGAVYLKLKDSISVIQKESLPNPGILQTKTTRTIQDSLFLYNNSKVDIITSIL